MINRIYLSILNTSYYTPYATMQHRNNLYLALRCCGVAIRSIYTLGVSPVLADELDEAIYSLFLRDVLLDTLLSFV